jgi:arsenate reductase-like glutaredoxin family protein
LEDGGSVLGALVIMPCSPLDEAQRRRARCKLEDDAVAATPLGQFLEVRSHVDIFHEYVFPRLDDKDLRNLASLGSVFRTMISTRTSSRALRNKSKKDGLIYDRRKHRMVSFFAEHVSMLYGSFSCDKCRNTKNKKKHSYRTLEDLEKHALSIADMKGARNRRHHQDMCHMFDAMRGVSPIRKVRGTGGTTPSRYVSYVRCHNTMMQL